MGPGLDGRFGPWRDEPDGAGVLLDFDGTLADIVEDPEAARLVHGAEPVLARLARRYRLVAMISGRPAGFLAHAVDVPGVERWGSYGLDRVAPGGHVVVDPAAAEWREQVASVVEAANAARPDGVTVEDKGTSVTLHVRRAPQHAAWVHAFAAQQADRTGLAVYDAKMSVELRPPLAVDKGTVVARLIEGASLRAACFVGDDLGDLSAFRALDAAAVAVRVAVRSAESPRALLEAADVVVDGPSGALALLAQLADLGRLTGR